MPRTSLASTPPEAPASGNPRWALESAVLAARIPASAKLIMCILMTCLGPSSLDLGKWSPGMRKLAGQASLNIHTVVRYVALLEAHGWLATRKHRGRRTEYALSAGRDFEDSARASNLPGVATTSNGSEFRGVATRGNRGVATTSNGGVATRGNTFRTCPDHKSDQGESQDQGHCLDGDGNQSGEQGRRPANTQEADQGVLPLVATLPAPGPDYIAEYLAQCRREKWAGQESLLDSSQASW